MTSPLRVGVVFVSILAACTIQKPVVNQLDPQKMPARVQSSVKAHLFDGSTVLFPRGVSVANNAVVGEGSRYALGSSTPTGVTRVSLDSIVGMEAYSKDVNVGLSILATTGAVIIGSVATLAAAVAIFGSCPTFYADSAGTQLLQGEGFSYAIAPLFEQRDVDRLRLTPTSDGRVVLNVKNEALETHYINQLELLEVRHDSDEVAVPDQTGHALALANNRVRASIHDRSGRNISPVVASADNKVFTTLRSRMETVSASDLDDYIDIAIAAPVGSDSVAVVLDMRNSLLNTVLLYDHILGAPGIKSLDFLGKDLDRIANAVDMGRWYAANMGMRVSVREGDKYRLIARLGDSGPIAFHRMAVLIPIVRGADDSVRVRLSFVADDWRIDEIGVADHWRRPSVRTVSLSRVVMPDARQNGGAAVAIREPDEDYLITSPGQSFYVEFDVGKTPAGERTWFAVSQGYYTEWVRGAWIKSASGRPFTPSNDALVDAIHGWTAKQSVMESQFYAQRISAR